jgi:hypothetical protein
MLYQELRFCNLFRRSHRANLKPSYTKSAVIYPQVFKVDEWQNATNEALNRWSSLNARMEVRRRLLTKRLKVIHLGYKNPGHANCRIYSEAVKTLKQVMSIGFATWRRPFSTDRTSLNLVSADQAWRKHFDEDRACL